MAGKPLNGRPPKERQDAGEWLVEFLSTNGEELASDIKKRGDRKGHTWRTLNHAKEEKGILSQRKGSLWYWVLPPNLMKEIEEETIHL